MTLKQGQTTTLLLLVVLATALQHCASSRNLQEQLLVGSYVTEIDVSEYNALAYDQQAIEAYLDEQDLDSAFNLYNKGAYSKSYARINILVPDSGIPQDTVLSSDSVKVKAMHDYMPGQTDVDLAYTSSGVVACRVGGSKDPQLSGCLPPVGNLTFYDNFDKTKQYSVQYAYNPETDNFNAHTIHQLTAKSMNFYPNGNFNAEPFEMIERYQDWYGTVNFADKWIEAAYKGEATAMDNGNGHFEYYDVPARAAAFKTATAYLAVSIFVLRQLDDTIAMCWETCPQNECNDSAVKYLDQAVAYYTGALEGSDTNSKGGNFMYALADTYCNLYKTCGDNGNSVSGTSSVNLRIMYLFNEMKTALMLHDCTESKRIKEHITSLFYIPLVQASLRYAYITDTEEEPTDEAEATGATFAAAIIPLVYRCSQKDARIIFDNTQTLQNGSCKYAEVRAALERHYDCLRITCADVGGLYNHETKSYFAGAEPCGFDYDEIREEEMEKRRHFIGLIISIAIFVSIVYWLKRRGQAILKQRQIDEEWEDDSEYDSDDSEDNNNERGRLA